MSDIKALIVDDHLILLEGLRNLLAVQGDIQVVATAGSSEEALEEMSHRSLDVVVTDLSMPGDGGLSLIKEIKLRRPTLPVLILSISADPQDVVGALQAGASGYLTKTASYEELEVAIKCVCKGDSYLQPRIVPLVIEALQQVPKTKPSDGFNERELTALQLLADGNGNRQISEDLMISVSTVKALLRRLFKKLNVTSRTELVVTALKLGLVKSPSEQGLSVNRDLGGTCSRGMGRNSSCTV